MYSNVLHNYIIRRFSKDLLITLAGMMALVFIFDLIELTRISSNHPSLSWSTIIKLALLKNYTTTNSILPFVTLLASFKMWLCMKRHNETVAIFTLGIPGSYIIMPSILVLLAFSLLHTTVFMPISSFLYKDYLTLKAKALHLGREPALLSKKGIWLKQAVGQNFVLLHIAHLSERENRLYNVDIFIFDQDTSFLQKIVAPEVEFIEDKWIAKRAVILNNKNKTSVQKNLPLELNIDFNQMLNGLAAPETINICVFTNFLEIAHSMGIDTLKYQIYFWKILFLPALLIYMNTLGYILSAPLKSLSHSHLAAPLGLFLGFISYTLNDLTISISTNNGVHAFASVALLSVLFLSISLYMLIRTDLHT